MYLNEDSWPQVTEPYQIQRDCQVLKIDPKTILVHFHVLLQIKFNLFFTGLEKVFHSTVLEHVCERSIQTLFRKKAIQLFDFATVQYISCDWKVHHYEKYKIYEFPTVSWPGWTWTMRQKDYLY